MIRRESEEYSIPHDRWLVSYSDFITLLFAFFVVMYSISQVNDGKYRVLSEALRNDFNNTQSTISQSILEPSQAGDISRTEEEVYFELYENNSSLIVGEGGYGKDEEKDPDILEEISILMESAFDELMGDELVSLKTTGDWLELELQSSLLFDSGKTALSTRAITIFEDVAFILKEYSNEVRVGGYTDNQQMSSPQYPSNWELSAARSAIVVRTLAEKGVDPMRMSAVGYGEFRPSSTNDTERGRARNRRVILFVSRRPMEELEVDVMGEIDEEELLNEIDSHLIKFDWEDEEEKPDLEPEIDGVKTIKLDDGGLRFTR